jgi:hypothetical protein
VRCPRCGGRCGTYGHYQSFCLKTRTAATQHFCCPTLECEVDEMAVAHEGPSVIQAMEEVERR